MTWAGLKKCMPMTSCGRFVAAAHSTTGSEPRRRREDGSRAADLVEVLEERALDGEVLDDGLDDEVDLGEVLEAGRAAHVGQGRVAVLLGGLAALDGLLEALGERRAHRLDLGVAAGHERHVEAGLGEDLDHAGGHRAGADDADRPDRARARRGVLRGRGRQGVVDDRRACPGRHTCRSRGRSCGP